MNVITATYSVQTQIDSAVLQQKSLILISFSVSLQQHLGAEEDVQRHLPEKTQHQVGLHVCVCEGCCLCSD